MLFIRIIRGFSRSTENYIDLFVIGYLYKSTTYFDSVFELAELSSCLLKHIAVSSSET